MSDLESNAGQKLWDEGGAPLSRAAAHLAAADPVMGALIERVGPCGLEPPPDLTPFQYLMRAIVGQQLSGKAAATIFGRVCRIYHPRPLPGPTAVLATTAERLRAAGLSGAKTRATHDLARFARARRLPSREALAAMDPESVISLLTEVRGVGRWTVEMLLIFYLGHPDVLPLTDLGVRKGFALTYRKRALPSHRVLARQGARWRPFRSVAAWYLWRALELPPP
jgi:3-methyladenine DNA glycosylase/8-oxoguanine DNA glycosylase